MPATSRTSDRCGTTRGSHFVEGDILDRPVVDRLMAETDAVVHFAAESHVDRSILGAADFVMTNVVGTQTLLDSALEAGLERFVHVSTDEVYGSIEQGSWDEEQPLEPNSPYSASKASADLLARAYHRTHGLPVIDHPVLQQLRAVPVPGEGHPAVRHQPDRRCRRAVVRRGRERP